MPNNSHLYAYKNNFNKYCQIHIKVELFFKTYLLLTHAIILCVPVGRFTAEDIETVNHFVKYFGEPLMKYVIVLFTRFVILEVLKNWYVFCADVYI